MATSQYSPEYFAALNEYYKGYVPQGSNLDVSKLQEWYLNNQGYVPGASITLPAPVQQTPTTNTATSQTVSQAAGATGSSGGSNVPSLTSQYDPNRYIAGTYDSLFNPMPSYLPTVAGFLAGPLGNLLFKGADAYASTVASNNMVDALNAYGVDAYDKTNPLLGTLMGTLGFMPGDVDGIKAVTSNFTTPESFFGYYDVATNPAVNAVFSDVYGSMDLSPDQVGAIGNAISTRIQSYVADGMPLAAAEYQASQDFASNSVPPLAGYDPLGNFIADLNDPFSDVSLGLDTMTSNTGAQGTNLGNGLVAYSDGSMRDAMTGAVVGGVVTDSQGNAVTSTDGTAVGWGVGVSPTYSGGSSDSGGGGYNYSGASDTGMATNDAGQSVSNDASIAAQDAASFGDSDSGSDSGGGGGGGSGRYCCSRMVHHGLWDVNHEFARLTVWSRKQPRWWRSGYPVWGKIIAKHLLGKVGFWTDVMQAFYDNKVRHKPRTWKSTLGELVIFPGAFVCGMLWREIPEKATLADPKEFA